MEQLMLAKDTAAMNRLESAARLHVLVVEDDCADAHLIERVLREVEQVGFIEIARDGLEALQYLDAGFVPPDLAIVDLSMPRLDGLGLMMELGCRERFTFPVVVLTSSTGQEDILRSVAGGARHVISKPHSFEELESALSAAIATCNFKSQTGNIERIRDKRRGGESH
jgi:CheY-like chemotaxis protein